MTSFEQTVHDAIAAQDIPGCAVISTNRDGSVQYAKAFGKTSMRPEHAKPFQLDTTVWIASFTKLMTSICAMQLVEQGHVELDEPIYKYIPELESLPIITSIEESTGKPVEEKNTTPITLRHLLTHTSGLSYDMLHPFTIAWLKHHGRSMNLSGKVLGRYTASPLVFTPGTGWCYGPSIDFAGLLVERISGKTLQAYMEEHLWGPLGIKDATFYPSSRPDLKARLADQSTRTPNGKLAHHAEQMPWADSQGNEVEDCMGGQGCFSTAEEYLKIVHAVLTSDEDEKVLKKATIEEFFKPQLGEESRAALNALLQFEMVNNTMGGTPRSTTKDWGLGGILTLTDDEETGMRKGTMLWNGYPNMTWWVDRTAGICGLYSGQVVPPGDGQVVKLQRVFQKEMYERVRKAKL